MERKSRFVTFLASLFPGVGYMYFGMLRKGLETITVFLLVPFVLRALWLEPLVPIFCVPVWFYTFFDTYHIARRYERGEEITDESWFVKDGESIKFNFNGVSDKAWKIGAWALIVIGILSLAGRIFDYFDVFYIARSYFVPVVFVLAGAYLLFRSKQN